MSVQTNILEDISVCFAWDMFIVVFVIVQLHIYISLFFISVCTFVFTCAVYDDGNDSNEDDDNSAYHNVR